MAYKKETTEKRDYRQELTDKVKANMDKLIEDLEANPNAKWNKTWFTCNERPVNPATGTVYSGINVLSLMSENFVDNRFYTYNNVATMEKERAQNIFDIKELSTKLEDKSITHAEFDKKMAVIETSFVNLEKMGLADRHLPIHVNKGAKGCPIFKLVEMNINKSTLKDNEDSEVVGDSKKQEEDSINKIRVMAYSGNVFNASQITNIKPKLENKLDFIPHVEAEENLMAMITKTGLKFRETEQARAYYSPATDTVHMPKRETFETVNDFYAVLLHELGHATGSTKRLGRDLSGSFGSKSYAFEELVADITSNLMSSDLGIPYNLKQHENHVVYVKSWSKALGEDKNFIFKAASKAEASVKYQHVTREAFKLEFNEKQEHKNDLKEVVKPTVSNQIKNKSGMSLSR